MAPEQARGEAAGVRFAGDLYSLGAVLYELLTGRAPFRGESAAETAHQVLTQDPVPPSRLNARMPRDLETICLKCPHKAPQDRYDGADALAEDLERFLRSEAIQARPENGVRRLARKVRRRPGLSAAVAAVLLLSALRVGGGLRLAAERSATARGFADEAAAAERATEDHLRETSAWLRESAWGDAAAALERARGRLGDRGSPASRRRLDQKARELRFATGVESVRLDLAARDGGESLAPHWVARYIRALRDAGIATPGERPGVVASRIRCSDIRYSILATIEECATLTPDESQRSWCLEVAGLDDDPGGWRARVRTRASSSDRAVLADLAAAAPLSSRDIPSILRLAQRMHIIGADPVPLLRRAQRAHPADFWINYLLGHVLSLNREFAESLRFLQAAATSRPDAGLIHNELGLTLTDAGRCDEAIEVLQRALATDPNAAAGHHNLAVALLQARRWDDAVAQSRMPPAWRPTWRRSSDPSEPDWNRPAGSRTRSPPTAGPCRSTPNRSRRRPNSAGS